MVTAGWSGVIRKNRTLLLIGIIPFGLGIFSCALLRSDIEYRRGVEAFNHGHYDLAEGYLQVSLQHHPKDPKKLSLLGWAILKQGRIQEAERFFSMAEKLDPRDIGTMEGLGWIYFQYGKDEEAKKKFIQLMEYAEGHIWSPFWNDYPRSDREFIQSLCSEANYGLGLIAKRHGRWEVAKKYFENALNHPNSFIDPYGIALELADSLFRLGEYEAAAFHYKRSISKDPFNPSLLNRLAWCLFKIGETKEAKSLFLKSKEFSAYRPGGFPISSEGQTPSQKIYAKKMAEPYFGLALIYSREGEMRAAREELASALRISPYFHHPEEILSLLDQNKQWLDLLN